MMKNTEKLYQLLRVDGLIQSAVSTSVIIYEIKSIAPLILELILPENLLFLVTNVI